MFEKILHNLPFTVDGMIRFQAQLNGSGVAVKTQDKTITYGDLNEHIQRVSNQLQQNGLSHGEYVVILLPNSIEFIIAIMAVMRAGAIAIPVYYYRKLPEIRSIQNRLLQFHVITTPDKSEVGNHTGTMGLWISERRNGEFISQFSSPPQKANGQKTVIDTDPALIMFTSGSTGLPKGIVLNHRNLMANVYSNIQEFQFTRRDVTLIYLPLTYLYAFSHQLLSTFLTGGTVYLGPSFFIPSKFRTLAIEEGITWFAATPPVFDAIAKEWEHQPQKRPLNQIRLLTLGGASSRPELIQRLRVVFPNAQMALTYGLTENAPRTATYFCTEAPHPTGMIGKILPNMRASLEALDTVGSQLVLEGSTVMTGTLGDDGHIIPFRGPLKTGDIARKDEAGNYYVLGRSHAVINNAGHKICPSEIESILYLHPSIEKAMVYGVPQTSGKETIQADVVLKEGQYLTVNDIYVHCRKYLSHYKIPRLVRFIKKFNWSVNGKLSNPILQEDVS